MTSVLTKASDIYNISSGEDQKSDDSDSEISNNGLDNSFELDTDRHMNTSGEMSDNSTKSSIASSSARGSSNVDDMEGSGEVSKAVTRVKDLTKKSPKNTNVKFHSKRKSKPKSQSEAMAEIAKSTENSSVQQEKNKDIRLQTLLEADRKRDEMFLAYQREQAEANRKHELLMAQFLLQQRPATMNMQYANYRN